MIKLIAKPPIRNSPDDYGIINESVYKYNHMFTYNSGYDNSKNNSVSVRCLPSVSFQAHT